MKYHKNVKETTVYYELIIYRAGEPWNKAENKLYKTFNSALRALLKMTQYNRVIDKAQIRREEVWFRNEDNEFSSSSPCLFYENRELRVVDPWQIMN